MADEAKLADTGGIVTTVKEETTKDLDVVARIAESDDGEPAVVIEGKPAGDVPAAKIVKDDDLKRQLDSSNAVRRRQDRELRELRARVDELAKKPDEKPAPAATKLVKPVKPNVANFSDADAYDEAEEKYAEDLAEYTYLVKRGEELRQAESAEQEAEDAEIISAFNDAAVEFEKTHADYREVMADAEVEMSPVMFGMVIEEGPALGYYFALHPDEADAIREITDNSQARKSERAYRRAERKAVRAIDKIIVKLEMSERKVETPSKKKPSEPVARVAGGGAAVAVSDKSKMTFKEREAEYARAHPGELNYK